MPLAMAAVGPSIVDDLAVDQNIAFVGWLKARQNFHQSRFAGAVFAKNADNSPLAKGNADAAIGLNDAKALMDVPQFDVHSLIVTQTGDLHIQRAASFFTTEARRR